MSTNTPSTVKYLAVAALALAAAACSSSSAPPSANPPSDTATVPSPVDSSSGPTSNRGKGGG